MVGGLNVRYFLPNIQRECVPQMRERVFSGRIQKL